MQEPSPPWLFRLRTGKFAAFVAVFVAFSVIVASGATAGIDDPVNRYAQSIQGNPALDVLMIAITTTGDVSTLFVFAIIITIIRRTRKAGMIFLIAIVVLAIVTMYMKPFFGRAVPPYAFVPGVELPENFNIETDSLAPFAAGFSYPSGHASRATALAFLVGYLLYRKARWAGYAVWAFPVIIGISRVYVQQHYPMDVIGGFLIGVVVSAVLANTMKIQVPFQMSRFKGKEDEQKA
ncbi:phosphatase PAP2 family protein [Nitrososphaera sp.]|uniref:phosphatase PAP2 family protein n=1 Tax=Nitrososphaera sp. TaxID=1971748 RepID=UPI0018263DD0|nr:phosphatase PAP2 family protein [Nitrososphaera sp.]NWG37902.1 phosphatase PAP2 family protein [Nitrososphaera sp.]